MVAAAIVGSAAVSTIGGAVLGGGASGSAAQQQQAGADAASQVQQNMFNTTQANLQPFIQGGTSAFQALQKLTGTDAGGNPLTSVLGSPIDISQAALEQTPGYQFTRDQGLKAVQNAASSRGLGVSGQALANAAQYATGLANNTYQTQFGLAQTNRQIIANPLLQMAQLGQNSGVNVGAQGVQTAANIGGNLIGAGNAGAAGTIGGANAISNALSGGGSQIGTAALLRPDLFNFGSNGNSLATNGSNSAGTMFDLSDVTF